MKIKFSYLSKFPLLSVLLHSVLICKKKVKRIKITELKSYNTALTQNVVSTFIKKQPNLYYH
jgi:hypothetical protein